MNLLDTIEANIAMALTEIDKTEQPSRFPDKYTYHTKTGSVNVRDEVIANIGLSDINDINYQIDSIGEENAVVNYGANQSCFKVPYDITATVKCLPFDNTINAANSKMNDIIEDIVFLFCKRNTLYNSCFSFNLIRSSRSYTKNNDMIESGIITMRFELQYGR